MSPHWTGCFRQLAGQRWRARGGSVALAGGEPGFRASSWPARRNPASFSSGDCEFLKQLERTCRAGRPPGAALRRLATGLRRSCARPSRPSCNRNACARSARWPAASRTTSTTPFRPSRSTPNRCWRMSPTSARAPADYLETIQRAIDDVAATVARMREFYRQREPQLTLAPVEYEPPGAASRGPDARALERHAAATRHRHRNRRPTWRRILPAHHGRRKRNPRSAHQPDFQRRGCDAGGRHADHSHQRRVESRR